MIQPLSGEYAGRRSLLEKLPFFTGYAVEIGLLIDILDHAGLAALGQVDLERRIHRNQPLPNLSQMAYVILQGAIRKLEERHRLELLTEVGRGMKFINTATTSTSRCARSVTNSPTDDHDPRLHRAPPVPEGPITAMPDRSLRVLIAPDSFGGALDSVAVAAAIGRGWSSVRGGDEVMRRPMADGGEGTLAAIADAVGDSAVRRTSKRPMPLDDRSRPTGCCSRMATAHSSRWPPPLAWHA